MGGDITLDSSPGNGSRFLVDLEYQPSVKIKNAQSSPKMQNDFLVGKCILIVEDEADNFEYLRILLKKLNITIHHAWGGAEALTIFNDHPEIDLVLMDFKLPDIPGQEVTKQILTLQKEIPVIATTAYAMSGDREKALQAGCVDYLPKPIRAEELATMLRRYLDRRLEQGSGCLK
jgi:CheY-like chemotaxis protein